MTAKTCSPNEVRYIPNRDWNKWWGRAYETGHAVKGMEAIDDTTLQPPTNEVEEVYDYLPEQFVTNLRAALTQKNITLGKLADALNIQQKTLYEYMHRLRRCPATKARYLATRFKVALGVEWKPTKQIKWVKGVSGSSVVGTKPSSDINPDNSTGGGIRCSQQDLKFT